METVKFLWRWLWFIPMALCMTGFCICLLIAFGPVQSGQYIRNMKEAIDLEYQMQVLNALKRGAMAVEELDRIKNGVN